ncbi:MAG: hypothetical protein U1F26_00920 [Lysobacterales bacterium]
MPVTLRSALAVAVFATLSCTSAHAQVAGVWQSVGPGPSHGGQVEGITNREVVGAVNAIAAHPSNADIVYVGAVNGGIWRTSNATAAAPTWTRLTDTLASLSIGSIEFDPTDANRQTLVAGVARSSSLSSLGGELIGMLRTTDGGNNWSVLTGGALAGRQVIGVAARGATLLAATDLGIYRSTDTGTAFTQISGGAGTGLPSGAVSDLAADPTVSTRLYTVITAAPNRGVYRTTDTGATWTKVSDAALDTVLNAGTGTRRTEIVVGASAQVFVVIVGSNGRLADVYRSPDGATGWTALGVPTTVEDGGAIIGIHPGGQGSIHLSAAADPTNANIVYVGGDRQPYFGEGIGSNNFFPNSIGANDYSGRLFRGDASQPAASRWTPLTHNGTSNNSSPHADSRDMAFDAAGNLLETDDGGVYKRINPRLTTGSWVSINGDLTSTEYHGIAYDAVSDRTLGGAQDTGTTEQRNTSTRIFDSVSTGDGGDVAVEDRSSTASSTRYTSFQNLGGFRRRTVNAANTVTATQFPALTVTAGPALTAAFYTPLATNYVDGARLLIGAANGLYESANRGDTVVQIATTAVNAFRGDPLVYGIVGNADFILAGSGTGIFRRTTSGGALSSIATLPATVIDVDADPDNAANLFGLTSTTVHYSNNSGTSFAAITGNLITAFSPGSLRTMAFVPGTDDALVVAADRGVYVSFASGGFSVWQRLGTGFPNAIVFELEYDRTDNVLVAGTLGRGAWILSPLVLSDNLFRNGFE